MEAVPQGAVTTIFPEGTEGAVACICVAESTVDGYSTEGLKVACRFVPVEVQLYPLSQKLG
jgi:hypothetical protein